MTLGCSSFIKCVPYLFDIRYESEKWQSTTDNEIIPRISRIERLKSDQSLLARDRNKNMLLLQANLFNLHEVLI